MNYRLSHYNNEKKAQTQGKFANTQNRLCNVNQQLWRAEVVDELRRTVQRYHRYQTVFYSFLYYFFSAWVIRDESEGFGR